MTNSSASVVCPEPATRGSGRDVAFALRSLIGLCLLLVVQGDIGAEQIYHFVDERGVPHFSNVPVDPRYRPLAMSNRFQGLSVQPSARKPPVPVSQDFEILPAPSTTVVKLPPSSDSDFLDSAEEDVTDVANPVDQTDQHSPEQ